MGDGRHSIRVISVNGHEFVSGLLWKTLAKVQAYEREAKVFGKAEGMDIVALRRTSETAYAGFVKAGIGAKKGQLSLAMALHGELGNDWFGAFELSSGEYYICAVNKESILPKGDAITDYEGARQFLSDALSRFGRAVEEGRYRIFAPVALKIPVASDGEKSLEELLDRRKYPREYRLRPLTWGMTAREWFYLAMVVVILIGGVTLYSIHKERVAEADRQAELRRQQLLAELEAESGREAELASLEYPWVHQSDPRLIVEECKARLNSAPIELGGWLFRRGACKAETGEVVLSYTRTPYATANDFASAARSKAVEFFDIDEAGDLGLVGHQLESVRFGDERLLDSQQSLASLHSHFQRRGVEMRVLEWSSRSFPSELIEAGASPWTMFRFEASAELIELVDIGRSFYQPGLRLDELLIDLPAGDVKQAMWTIRGEQYGSQ